jgi:hypothetical protein
MKSKFLAKYRAMPSNRDSNARNRCIYCQVELIKGRQSCRPCGLRKSRT